MMCLSFIFKAAENLLIKIHTTNHKIKNHINIRPLGMV